MPKLSIRQKDNLGWINAGRAVAPETAAKFGDGDANSDICVHHRGSDTDLQLFEVRVPPNQATSQHAHVEDEIMYVVGGEIHFGAQIVGPGSSVYVPGNTLYTFKSGPEGATFLNFRARHDASFISKSELANKRRARP